MVVYTNKLGIVCIEPNEGYLLKKGNEIYKKVYLGKNDRAELYEEIIDENYVHEEKTVEINVVIDDLTSLKYELIKLSKTNLTKYLENNPLFSKVKYKEGRYYNVNIEHQLRITSQLFLYKNNEEYQIMWNDTGNIYEEWTYEELLSLSNEMNEYIRPLVKKQQEIELNIKNAENKETLLNIKIEY